MSTHASRTEFGSMKRSGWFLNQLALDVQQFSLLCSLHRMLLLHTDLLRQLNDYPSGV